MNYCEEQLEYLEYKAQLEQEKNTQPCDISTGVYILVDDASPSESPVYFKTLNGAVAWAESGDQYITYRGESQWSVYRVGEKVL